MFDSDKPDNSPDKQGNKTSDISSHGAQLPVEQSDKNSWHTVNFPGTIAIDQIPGPTPYLRTNAMDSSSNHHSNINTPQPASTEPSSQRETELLSLVRDLNECNDVLLAKVSQLEESLERSQAALQAEIDRSGVPASGDREIVQLVTEIEQSKQALQHQHILNETLQAELSTLRERTNHLETEHSTLVRQTTEQSQELLQANANCRDLRARLQRQQRYTLQFKAALEKCLTMSPEVANQAPGNFSKAGVMAMPKTDEIRPWESPVGYKAADPQLESMIRGIQSGHLTPPSQPTSTEAEDQLWHDLARVMDPEDAPSNLEPQDAFQTQNNFEPEADATEFTEPSPWVKSPATLTTDDDRFVEDEGIQEPPVTAPSPVSPDTAEILARVQASKIVTSGDMYIPAVSAQGGSPSPLVSPLKPQKRIGSLSAIDLPSFPKLKQQPPAAKA